MPMIRYIVAFLILASTVRADCVWVPVCFAPQATPIEAMRIYLDGVRVREIRPMWAPMGGRTNFWQCGGSGQRLTASTVKGAVETPMAFATDGPGFSVSSCTGTGPAVTQAPRLGAYYGPKEQTLRAIQRLYTTNNPNPIDTDQDGTIRTNDMQLIWDHVLGRFPDYTDNICTSEVCP